MDEQSQTPTTPQNQPTEPVAMPSTDTAMSNPAPVAPVADPNLAQAAADLTAAAEPVAVAVPAAAESVEPAVAQLSTVPEQGAPEQPGEHMKKILLVEDDDALASVYQTRLQAEGFDLRRVPNGEDALAAALEYKPDLILLDVMMPKVSGFDVLDILRNTPETTNVKIVMLTALSQDSDKARAESLGVDDYLVKSQVVIADVVDKIKAHLGMI